MQNQNIPSSFESKKSFEALSRKVASQPALKRRLLFWLNFGAYQKTARKFFDALKTQPKTAENFGSLLIAIGKLNTVENFKGENPLRKEMISYASEKYAGFENFVGSRHVGLKILNHPEMDLAGGRGSFSVYESGVGIIPGADFIDSWTGSSMTKALQKAVCRCVENAIEDHGTFAKIQNFEPIAYGLTGKPSGVFESSEIDADVGLDVIVKDHEQAAIRMGAVGNDLLLKCGKFQTAIAKAKVSNERFNNFTPCPF